MTDFSQSRAHAVTSCRSTQQHPEPTREVPGLAAHELRISAASRCAADPSSFLRVRDARTSARLGSTGPRRRDDSKRTARADRTSTARRPRRRSRTSGDRGQQIARCVFPPRSSPTRLLAPRRGANEGASLVRVAGGASSSPLIPSRVFRGFEATGVFLSTIPRDFMRKRADVKQSLAYPRAAASRVPRRRFRTFPRRSRSREKFVSVPPRRAAASLATAKLEPPPASHARRSPRSRCGERWWSSGGRSACRDVSARA